MIRRAPEQPTMTYLVELHEVAGLRLVEDALEFLDEAGAPRLRMSAPFIVGPHASGAGAMLARVRTEVEGCAYDDDPRGPWGRPVVAPGADRCAVVLTWNADMAYPALLDPSWALAEQLGAGRVDHTATLLSDGTVLVVGGGLLNSAELFDPVTGTFAATGAPSVARSNHGAALLSNGQVLIAGGPDSSTELYDSGSFSPGPPMVEDHNTGTTSTLPDGRVLVFGGWSGSTLPELFTPDPGGGGSWTVGATAPSQHDVHAVTVMLDGRVLVTGRDFSPTALAEIYDPVADSWTPQPDMDTDRSGHTSSLLPDGRVMVAGGWDDNANILGSTQMFEPPVGPGQGTWTSIASSGPRAFHRATVLSSGQIMFTGGWDTNWDEVNDVPVYEPVSGTFSWTAPMNEARIYHTATRLQDGRVLVLGGEYLDADFNTQSALQVELFISGGLGEGCGAESDCASASCVDGVCCDAACDGACESCIVSEKGFGADGNCELLSEGSADQACTDEGEPSCGTTGLCGANGECAFYPEGTGCGIRACFDGTLTSSECSGQGGCVQTLSSCAPFACASADACATACSTSAECSANTYCNADGSCEPVGELGADCSEAAECAGLACVDGKCGESSACVDEHTRQPPEGAAVDCSPYKCVDGACLIDCESVLDCRSGRICNAAGVCVLPTKPETVDDSGGCSVSAPAGRAHRFAWMFALAAMVWRVRRRRTRVSHCGVGGLSHVACQ